MQLLLTLGLALLLSALSVHFRDIRDLLGNLLTLWFFATPIIYPYSQAPERFRALLDLNPFTHLAVAYQEVLFWTGRIAGWRPRAGGWRRWPRWSCWLRATPSSIGCARPSRRKCEPDLPAPSRSATSTSSTGGTAAARTSGR